MTARGFAFVFIGGAAVGLTGAPRWGQVVMCAVLGVLAGTYEHLRKGRGR